MIQEKYVTPRKLQTVSCILMATGVLAFATGFFSDPERTWANYLLNNFYFISLAIGAAFFISIQYVSQSGWSAAFKRIPEAVTAYIPVAAVFSLGLAFGLHALYEWSHRNVAAADALIAHKSPYLNVPFFIFRVVLFFGLWILLTWRMRRLSLREDITGGMACFQRMEHLSRVFIFVVAITFSLFAIDMIMSLEAHWFSTIFAAKAFISAFLHGSAVIALIVILLNRAGYLKILNRSHLHDFTRYIFMLSIIWGYFAFAQYMLIWYGNIPEETIYYVHRDGPFEVLFFLQIALNWFIPFLFLMPRKSSRSKMVLVPVIILLMVGHYVELYYEIWPAVVGEAVFGLREAGAFTGFAGLFVWVVARALAKAPLIPEKHPYLEESLAHHF